MLARMLVVLAMAFAIAMPAEAHEVRPAFLQIREIEPAVYDVLWKTPAQGDLRLALNVVWPRQCHVLSAPRAALVKAAVVEHLRTVCDGGLPGRQIGFENLQSSLT